MNQKDEQELLEDATKALDMAKLVVSSRGFNSVADQPIISIVFNAMFAELRSNRDFGKMMGLEQDQPKGEQ